jgi:hypothetical protein
MPIPLNEAAPMLHQLLQLLPNWLMHCVPVVLAWGVVAGVMLWALGARFSRSMLTLLAVTVGSWIGIRLPPFFGWSIEPMCVGVLGAIVMGTAAYLFHRTLIGIGLGAIAALWAITAVWLRFDGPNQWPSIDLHWTGSLVIFLTKIWQSLPGDLGVVLPYACGAGLASGILTGVLWPRLGRCLLYSLIGSTLILMAGLPLAMHLQPNWMELAPASIQTQLLILFGFIGVGAAVQWCLTREPAKPKPERVPHAETGPVNPQREPKPPAKRARLAQCRPVVPVPVR